MFWQRLWLRDPEERLATALAGCRGRIGKGLRRELCNLDTPVLARLLADVWPRLEDITRDRLRVLAEEEGLVDAMVRMLAQGKPGDKARAATVLGLMGVNRALGQLLAALGDRDEGVQMAAAAALARLRDRRCLEPLLIALAEPRRWPPARVAEILLALGPASIPPLLELLHRGPDDVAVRVVDILGLFQDEQVQPALEYYLKTGTAAVRRAAALALGGTGGPAAAAALLDALSDPEAPVRAAAARSLGALKHSSAEASLRSCLADDSWEVRVAVAAALEEIASTGGK